MVFHPKKLCRSLLGIATLLLPLATTATEEVVVSETFLVRKFDQYYPVVIAKGESKILIHRSEPEKTISRIEKKKTSTLLFSTRQGNIPIQINHTVSLDEQVDRVFLGMGKREDEDRRAKQRQDRKEDAFYEVASHRSPF